MFGTFDITRCQRLSQLNEKIIKQYEKQTGASIIVNTGQNTTLTISGDSSQFMKAKVLIRDFLEKTSFIPALSYFILVEPVSNNIKLKFTKFNEKTVEIHDDGGDYANDDDDDDDDDIDSLDGSDIKTRYFIEFNETEDDHDADNPEEFLNLITPCQFNTLNKIDDCLERLFLKIKTTIKRSLTFPDKIVFKPKIFFGKLLFFNLINPEDPFVLQEWYRFNVLSKRGRSESIDDCSCDDGGLYDSKIVNNEFQQGSTLVENNFEKLRQKFEFKLVDEQGKNKEKVNITYVPTANKKRKITLRWNERENKWKVAINAHGSNRLANIDVVSGSKAPDFRFSLKSFYDLPSEGTEIEKTINEVQSRIPDERDNMWFKSKDFKGTIINRAVIRQVIKKKCYKNENYSITFSTVKQEEKGKFFIQDSITLKHRFWDQEISLDNVEEFIMSIMETFLYAREMISVLA
ncbi:hypothetical protein RclHR1_16550005 [Rhizophagus clarus]|uniref:K Homology domain-containing protein n=1 Tax=Rhizophagus clarus TaxID=94130 RepID=A0A2Z6RAM6_9GLOM|nr:hypothetical protein RclHR1_16550005 [Rhizophagus clarus]GET03502.1 hypothetical protein GLOIN_2v1769164 [Rhizophagus clarus]